MRWVLRIKALNYNKDFMFALLQTGSRPVVEKSTKDFFWGALEVNEFFVGVNVLGRLLMELREEMRSPTGFSSLSIDPPKIDGFLLCGNVVGKIGKEINQPFCSPE